METQMHLTLEGNTVISVSHFRHFGDDEVRTEGTNEMLDHSLFRANQDLLIKGAAHYDTDILHNGDIMFQLLDKLNIDVLCYLKRI